VRKLLKRNGLVEKRHPVWQVLNEDRLFGMQQAINVEWSGGASSNGMRE
jgi:hypothetical protein